MRETQTKATIYGVGVTTGEDSGERWIIDHCRSWVTPQPQETQMSYDNATDLTDSPPNRRYSTRLADETPKLSDLL